MHNLNIPDEFFEEHPTPILQREYIRVWEAINTLWGTIECQFYLDKLVIQSDNNSHQGFPFEVFIEIIELHNIHADLSISLCKDFTGWRTLDKKQ